MKQNSLEYFLTQKEKSKLKNLLKMNRNFLIQSFDYLKIILNKIQKGHALNLLIMMFVGMVFEILLLNNLVILLNYLTGSGAQTPKIVYLLQNYLNFENITVLVLIIFITTFLLKTFLNIIVRFKESRFLYKSKAQISERLFVGYLKLPFIFHQRTNSAEILKNITREIDQFASFLLSISKLILESMVMIGISLYLMYFDFYTSVTCILAFIIFGYLFNYFNKKKIGLMGISRLTHENGRLRSLIEGLSGVREIKLSSKDGNIIKNFIYHNNSIAKINISMTLRNALSKPAFEIFMLILLSIALFYFILQNLLSATLIPILGIYLAAAYRLVPSVAIIVQSIQEIQFSLKGVKNLKDDIKKFELNQIKNNYEKNKIKFQNKIEIKGLSFSYDLPDKKEKNKIFDKLNLEIKKGDFIGIHGESGSGKSTFLDLLVGLQTPYDGKILVDGGNIHENLKNWQNLIGCVPQEVFISDDTLRKNIAFGVLEENISHNNIEKSIEFANLKNFSKNLENGIDTIIGERGSRLSGGQKQRIGIARAMYYDPDILIFDESTNSLDIETENKIIDEINLYRKNKTIIIVSHKENLFKNCDYIYKIENKKINKTFKN